VTITDLTNDELCMLIADEAALLEAALLHAHASGAMDGPVTKQTIHARVARLSVLTEAIAEEPKS